MGTHTPWPEHPPTHYSRSSHHSHLISSSLFPSCLSNPHPPLFFPSLHLIFSPCPSPFPLLAILSLEFPLLFHVPALHEQNQSSIPKTWVPG